MVGWTYCMQLYPVEKSVKSINQLAIALYLSMERERAS
jgi:hypothetical protein